MNFPRTRRQYQQEYIRLSQRPINSTEKQRKHDQKPLNCGGMYLYVGSLFIIQNVYISIRNGIFMNLGMLDLSIRF